MTTNFPQSDTANNRPATKIERLMGRIAALISLANHKNTPPAEASAARIQAEHLMNKHRIDEASLTDSERATAGVRVSEMRWPIIEDVKYNALDRALSLYYSRIAGIIARHVGVRYAYTRHLAEDGTKWYGVRAFGFESDLAFGNMLLQSAVKAYGEHMFPVVDRGESDSENIYRMRSAGMERNRIAAALWGSDLKDGVAAGKVAKLYKEIAVANGDDPGDLMGKGNSMKVYRINYAFAFCNTLEDRLRIAKSSVGNAEMVLASRGKEVEEAFYTAYPHLRPSGEVVEYKECKRCKAAKSGHCNDHRPIKNKTIRANATAQKRGADAARRVDLHRAGQARPIGDN